MDEPRPAPYHFWGVIVFALVAGITLINGSWLAWTGESWPSRAISGPLALAFLALSLNGLRTGEVATLVLWRPVITTRRENPLGFWCGLGAFVVLAIIFGVEVIWPGLIHALVIH